MDPGVAQGSYRYYVSLDFGTHGSGFAYSAKVDGDCVPRTYEVGLCYSLSLLSRSDQNDVLGK